MTMNYRSAKEKKEKRKRGMQFALVILLVVLGFSGVYNWISTGFSPVSAGFWKFASGDLSLRFVLQDKKYLERDVQSLKEEVARLEIEVLRTELIRQENEDLKESLGRLSNEAAILGHIIRKPNQTLYDSIVIDAGIDQGVGVGDIALAYGAVAIGRVVDVRENISHVQLFTTSDSISNLIHIPTGLQVEAVGKGGSAIEFTIQRDLEVVEGDIIALPDIRSYIVGTVQNISFNPTDPFQTVLVQSAVNINELRFVQIVDGYGEQLQF
jgi:cell shape-determining protein MreC